MIQTQLVLFVFGLGFLGSDPSQTADETEVEICFSAFVEKKVAPYWIFSQKGNAILGFTMSRQGNSEPFPSSSTTSCEYL